MRMKAVLVSSWLALVMPWAGRSEHRALPPGEPDPPGVLASLDGERLAFEEVADSVVEATEKERFNRLYHTGRYQYALFVETLREREKWIEDRLLMVAARERGVSVADYLLAETKELGMRDIDAGREAVVRQLRTAASRRLEVPPYRLPVETVNQPALGSPGAEVEVVSYLDFFCGKCANLEEDLRDLLRKYPGRVRLVAMHFPLSDSSGPSFRLVEAAYCAAEQQKYWEFRAEMLRSLDRSSDDPLDAAFRTGARIGLDNGRLRSCLNGRQFLGRVRAEQEGAARIGVFGVPVVLVNGRRVPGVSQAGAIEELVRIELESGAAPEARR